MLHKISPTNEPNGPITTNANGVIIKNTIKGTKNTLTALGLIFFANFST